MISGSKPLTLAGVLRPSVAAAARAALRSAAKRPLGAAGMFMLVVVALVALLAPVLAGHDVNAQDYRQRLQGPSLTHLMGTDEFGRDLWARVAYGSRVSLLVGVAAVALGSLGGLALGLAGGYAGGAVDELLQRLVEVVLSLPGVLLALALMATLGSGVDKVVLALSIVYLPVTLRVVRASVLSVKENAYIEAARAVGAGSLRIVLRHVLPNAAPVYLVLASGLLGSAVLTEATLSFLGLGVPPPLPSWGRLLSSSVAQYARTAPWMVVFPGIAITWLVLAFNLVGDALRDAWDPRLRGR